MKRWVRIISLGLAALMVMGTLFSLFSMLAYGMETASSSKSSSSSSSSSSDASSSSSSSSDEDWETTGTLRLLNRPLFQEVDQDGELVKDEDKYTGSITKSRTYRVILNVLDTQTRFEDVISSGENYSDYDYALEKLDVYDITRPAPCVVQNGYVVSNGGNIITAANRNNRYFEPTIIAYDKGGSTGLVLIFYVSPNGKGRRMNLDVWYDTASTDGASSRASGTIFMRVGEAQVDPGEEDEKEDGYKVPTPNIIITSYNYGGQQIMAGSEFPLNVKFRNTSDDLGLENIIVNLTTTADLAVSQGSNSNFLEKLDAGESGEMSTTFSVSTTIAPEPQQVTVKFSYEYVLNKERKTVERTEVLAIPIVQLDRFQVGELSVPQQIFPGDTSYINLEYVNKGKGEVANLSARLETSVPGVGEVMNVGNVKAGDSGTIDFSFTVNESGPISGKVIVTYEDLKGSEKTIERPFTATVVDFGGGGDISAEVPVAPPAETGLNKTAKLMAGAGGLLLAGLVFTIVVRRAKIKREEDSDEDL